MANFLVTDLKVIDSPQAGIGVARCLRAAGHTVYGADDTPFVTTADIFSEVLVLEELRTLNIDGLMEKLAHYCSVYKIEYIIPCYDETVILFSFLRERIEKLGVTIIAPNMETLKQIKKSNLSSISVPSLRAPDTVHVKSSASARQAAEQIGYPVFVKGLVKGAIIANDEAELDIVILKVCNQTVDCIIQKAINGTQRNVLVAYKNNKVIAYLEAEKVGMDLNGATWFGKMTTSKELLEPISALLAQINSNDCIIEFETIQDSEGNNYIYEINPRSTAWVYASCLNGVNFLDIFIQPQSETVFNLKEIYFGRETTDYIKELPSSADLSSATGYAKTIRHKGGEHSLPSELIL